MMKEKNLHAIFAAGRLVSPFYGFAMWLRAYMYQKGIILKTRRLPVPVISIGNLTLGGTGKTPMTQFVVRHLLAKGRRPLIISRGYGGRTTGGPRVVSDGTSMLMSPAEAGDEPCLLAESLSGVPVVIGRKRYEAGLFALEKFSADVIVLDDAFQHLGVARDLDVVLFKSGAFLGNGRVFPGGPLREPLSALQRADVFVVTGLPGEEQNAVALFSKMLKNRFPSTPSFSGL
jgi:tetraacyldisaccharide 4'-kinase